MINTSVFQNKKAAYFTLGCKLNFSETFPRQFFVLLPKRDAMLQVFQAQLQNHGYPNQLLLWKKNEKLPRK